MSKEILPLTNELRTLNVTVDQLGVKRPLRISADGKDLCVKIRGEYRVVYVSDSESVYLTDRTVPESRAATYRDLGLKTKAEREAEAEKARMTRALRTDNAQGQRASALDRLTKAFPELTAEQASVIAMLIAKA